MGLGSKLVKGMVVALSLYACAKADDSDLVGSPESSAGKGGSAGRGGAGGAGGVGGATGGAGGASGKGGAGGVGVGGGAGVGGSSGLGGTAGIGAAGGPACGEMTEAGLVVHYLVGNAAASSDQIFMHLYFENQSDEALSMARVTVRYWMTAETMAFNPAVTDYRGGQIAGEHAEYVDDGEFSHLLITFTGNEIPANNTDLNPSEVQFRIQGQNGARFDQSNDWSFAPALTVRAPHDRITAYVDGLLTWGQEPSGRCPGEGQGGQGGEGGEPGTGGSTAGGQGGEGGQSGAPN